MSDQIADSWLVGVVATGDALSGLRIHGGYVAAGPAGGRAHRVQVRLRYVSESESGFPDATVSEALLATESTLVEALEDLAVLVATVTLPGYRDLIFHAADPHACVDVCAEVGLSEVDHFLDPSWSAYRALFADAVPADNDRRRIEEVARRTGEGAPLCTVAHRFDFAGLGEADQAAAAMRDAGLTVAFLAAEEASTDAPPSYVVTETETLTQLDMARSRDVLGAFAASWGGTYAGWEIVDS